MFIRRRVFPVLVALGCLATTPVDARQRSADLSVPYTMFTLDHGLTVILHEDHSVPVVSVNVWYHAGSAHEKPGRTGFAHLFEHLMFEGSRHVKEGDFDNFLEAAGGSNNASTRNDYTNYYINVPSNALDLALFLESDRMGYLLDIVSEELVNGQRDVVKNERRQSYENAPYGRAYLRMSELMYPKNHPYHWPVIGYMEDLSAASAEDVRDFFRTYYAPQNASLVVAGDIDPVDARRKIEHWFSDVKPGRLAEPIEVPPVSLPGVVTEQIEDNVQLPRLFMLWHTPPTYAPGDAELDVVSNVLTAGKNSRLYKRLVYDLQVAQNVSASQNSAPLGSMYLIDVVARPSSDPPAVTLAKLKAIVDEEIEKLRSAPPDAREVERALNQAEASFYNRMERIGGFGGKADQLNGYYTATGNPDFFNEDLSRYLALRPDDIQAAVRKWLVPDRRVEITVVPASTESGK
ncbi:MAG TPA: pitrilysin family protein [Vicinamibacterales bacterium]|nr:pitrilysin family protein [Vicinamibacterales bacterium]